MWVTCVKFELNEHWTHIYYYHRYYLYITRYMLTRVNAKVREPSREWMWRYIETNEETSWQVTERLKIFSVTENLYTVLPDFRRRIYTYTRVYKNMPRIEASLISIYRMNGSALRKKKNQKNRNRATRENF